MIGFSRCREALRQQRLPKTPDRCRIVGKLIPRGRLLFMVRWMGPAPQTRDVRMRWWMETKPWKQLTDL